MKALVTGGAGFIGSHLADQLLSNGYKVTVWDNLNTGSQSNLPKHRNLEFTEIGVEHIHGHNKTDWRLLGAGTRYDVIFHLAAESRIQPSLRDPSRCIEVNVIGTKNVLEIARRHKARLIFTSTSATIGDQYLNPYALSKLQGEQLCILYRTMYQTSIAIARLFNVYGDRQPNNGDYATVVGIFAEQTKKGKRLSIVGDGEQRRDFIHVADVVDCLMHLSQEERKCEIFQVGTGTNYSVNEVAEMFQPGAKRKLLPQRPGELRSTLADLRQAPPDWLPKRSLEDYVTSLTQQKDLQSSP